MNKFLTSVWCTLIVAISLGTICFIIATKIFNENEPVILSVCVTTIIFIITQKLIMDRETRKSKKIEDDNIRKEFDCRPTFAYVDKQDKHNTDLLMQHIEESKTVMELIRSIDSKINILIGK